MDLTKRQQEIFDFIQPPPRPSTAIPRRCATSARRWASRRRRPCTRTWRISRRSDCCAATRPSPERSRCSTRRRPAPRRVSAASCGPDCRSSARSRLGSRCGRGTSRTYIQTPGFGGRRRRRVSAARAGESMKDVGILDGDLVVVRPAGDGRRRQHRGRARGRRGDRQALLPRGRPHPTPARERGDGADPQPRRERARQGRWPDAEHGVRGGR